MHGESFGLPAAQATFDEKYGGQSKFDHMLHGKIGFVGQIRGHGDPLFRRLAAQFNQLSTSIRINTLLNPEEMAKLATWVIEGNGKMQGTAFFVDGIGLVTCEHCLDDNLYIYHPSNHSVQYPVSVISLDKHRDLAILSTPSDLKTISPLKIRAAPPLEQSHAILLGYPNHHKAPPIRMEAGHLIRKIVRSDVEYFEITPKIIEGNSGGPLLSSEFEVIGVAVRGLNGQVDLKTSEFLAVAVKELQHLKPQNSA